jgi:prophage regulatory protein
MIPVTKAINFDLLSDSAYLRLGDFCASPRSRGNALIPASRMTILRWVKAGKFPPSFKLGDRAVAWRVGDLRAWLNDRSKN